MTSSATKNWFVYIIESQKDFTLYTGSTIDVEKRLAKHNAGKGSKYTKSRTPFILIKSFGPMSKSGALKLECKIKKLSKKEKLNLKKRFEVVSNQDLIEIGFDYLEDYGWSIVENMPDGSIKIIGSDGGEPEDQLLVRNWAWVCVELNRINEEP